jgi:hypothetical protein
VPRSTAIYSELVVQWGGEIEIASELGTIRLAPRTELALRNASSGSGGSTGEINHFRIYERLAESTASLSAGPRPISGIPASSSIHPVFDEPLTDRLTLLCSNTGCCQ